MRKKAGVCGARIIEELREYRCSEVHTPQRDKKNIAITQSFNKNVESLDELSRFVSAFAERGGEKLRESNLNCKKILVFIRTNPFNRENYFADSKEISLPSYTSYTPLIIFYALQGLRQIFKAGHGYKKAGIILCDLVTTPQIPEELFQFNKKKAYDNIMAAIDRINQRYGKQTVSYGSVENSQICKSVRQKLSPCFTTSWKDIVKL